MKDKNEKIINILEENISYINEVLNNLNKDYHYVEFGDKNYISNKLDEVEKNLTAIHLFANEYLLLSKYNNNYIFLNYITDKYTTFPYSTFIDFFNNDEELKMVFNRSGFFIVGKDIIYQNSYSKFLKETIYLRKGLINIGKMKHFDVNQYKREEIAKIVEDYKNYLNEFMDEKLDDSIYTLLTNSFNTEIREKYSLSKKQVSKENVINTLKMNLGNVRDLIMFLDDLLDFKKRTVLKSVNDFSEAFTNIFRKKLENYLKMNKWL